MTLAVDVQYGTRHPWAPSARRLGEWARAAVGRAGANTTLSIRVVTTAESCRLNREYRGKDRPTNVLSFPMGAVPEAAGVGPLPLGDLAICARVVAREAREQRKTLAAHWAHMVVHGTLHLIGYDHEVEADAQRMERRERTVLRGLGFADPYEVPDDG
jgi:probable rRNA maturation factor